MNHQELRDQLISIDSIAEYRDQLVWMRRTGHDMAGHLAVPADTIPPQGSDVWRLIRALAEAALEDLEKSLPRPVYETLNSAYGYADGTIVTLLSLQEDLDNAGYIVELRACDGYIYENETGEIVAWKAPQ